MYMVKIFSTATAPDQPIELKTSNPNSAIVGSNEFRGTIGDRIKIIDTNYYIKILIDDRVSVDWNRGKLG